MRTSTDINEVAAALAKAQGQMEGAKKDCANPFFKSKYADLASVWAACRDALSANGLSVLQSPRLVDKGEQWLVEVETILMHGSGQFIADTLAVPLAKLDPQSIGSAETYCRRYSLAAFVGVAPEDDDGETAMGRTAPAQTNQRPTAKPNGKKPADDPLATKTDAERSPEEIYNSASKAIKAATVPRLSAIKGGIDQYAAEGKLDKDQVRTLYALLERREDELSATMKELQTA